MATKKKSSAVKFLEEVSGGPLTFGSLLNSIRLSDEMTQEQMAKKLGVTKGHLSQIENGRKFVSPDRAQTFAKKLGYSEVMFIKLSLQDQLTRVKLPYKVEIEAA
ncbi:helix-turn-helix domain-containing protein [Bdellovibrio sp. NC01]|uniref:helix-turn-helix domain-containing protein n=1 Tax=Bdellovibrio sp. NC01 TaxID=2220073 RepID=UPI001157EFB3|nr:helix-turn-helix transcriptional regulator [Bdellovibrio sp. NC01]QDK37963.1 XRE family transcriptional regulator [Bdellovibrio sp. NC01]